MRKEATGIVLLALSLICVLAFAAGLTLAGSGGVSAEYQAAVESLRLDTTAKMHWIRVGFWGGLATIALVGVGGLVVGLVRVVWQRSQLIGPHPSGIFPVVEGRVGGQIYYHDPNRQWAGTTAYGAGLEGVTVRHLVPAGQEEAQLQIAAQAQATQLVAAASQGQGLTPQARRLVEQVALTAPARSAPRLPQVVVLDEAIPKERHLLTALRRDWGEGG
jgi:hypothetical protein